MNLTEIEKAYIAGFFDGEGTIGIAAVTRRPNGITKNGYRLYIVIGQVDGDFLHWLKAKYKGYLLLRPRRENHQPIWQWRLENRLARIFLTDIQPYLRLKAQQCALGLAFQQTKGLRKNRGVTGFTPEEWAFEEEVYTKMRELNHKGAA